MVGCRIRDVGFSKAGEQRSDLNLFTFVPFLQDASCAPLWTRRRYWFRPHSRTTYTPLLQRLCSQSTSPSHPRAPRHPLPAEIRCYEIHRFVLSASYRDLTAMSAHSQHRKSSVRRFGYMNYRGKENNANRSFFSYLRRSTATLTFKSHRTLLLYKTR